MSEPGHSGYDSISFGGIFRGPRTEHVAKMVAKAQAHLSDDDLKAAKNTLREVLESCCDSCDLDYLRWIIAELTRYEKHKIPAKCKSAKYVHAADVHNRPVQRLSEKFEDLPQSIILIKFRRHGEAVSFVVGRKLLSSLYQKALTSELHCSMVTTSMLLGSLDDQRVTENGVTLFYRPFTNSEKLLVMEDIYYNMTDIEITYPFPMLRPDTKQELCCPTDGWNVDEDFAGQLEEGEILLRHYSLEFLINLHKENLRVYDPACSNGEFLEKMKDGLPNAYFIGQDLNPTMVKYAEKKIDEAHCGNCLIPKVEKESIDVAFFRFLNSEIIKTEVAMTLLSAVCSTIKPGGHVIIFGHTPVLLSSSDLQSLAGWHLIQSVGGGRKWNGIFQFYVLQKKQFRTKKCQHFAPCQRKEIMSTIFLLSSTVGNIHWQNNEHEIHMKYYGK